MDVKIANAVGGYLETLYDVTRCFYFYFLPILCI